MTQVHYEFNASIAYHDGFAAQVTERGENEQGSLAHYFILFSLERARMEGRAVGSHLVVEYVSWQLPI